MCLLQIVTFVTKPTQFCFQGQLQSFCYAGATTGSVQNDVTISVS